MSILRPDGIQFGGGYGHSAVTTSKIVDGFITDLHRPVALVMVVVGQILKTQEL